MSIGEAATAYGVTPRQLEHWICRGYLRVARRGYGNVRLIDEAEQAVAAQLVRLLAIGFRWEAAAPIARQLAEMPGTPVALADGVQLTVTEKETAA